MKANLKAFEYTSEDGFIESEYLFTGDTSTGWTIMRDGREHLALGPGYRLLRTMYCGICSTDLARIHLPFSLPRVICHEGVSSSGEKQARNTLLRFLASGGRVRSSRCGDLRQAANILRKDSKTAALLEKNIITHEGFPPAASRKPMRWRKSALPSR